MTPDIYAPHLRQADELFARGEAVKAGQIWQAILKQQPTHAEARERLVALKQHLLALREAEAAARPLPEPLPSPEPTPSPEPPVQAPEPALEVRPSPEPPPTAPARQSARDITGALDPDRLLAEGCTLYDMGQFEDALRKWEQLLTLAPEHRLARGYADGARRELGLPPLAAPAAPAPVAMVAPPAEDDLDKLLREAVQLYDMGLTEEAITKWERILVLEPERSEIQGYLRQARAEIEGRPPTPVAAPPPPPPAPEAENLDLKLRQAEHLLTLQRHEEAAFTFQQALRLDPGNARAREGLERCRKPVGGAAPVPSSRPAPAVQLDTQGRIAMANQEASFPQEPQGIEPPAALLQAAPAPREGFSLPDRLRVVTERLPWLKDPRVLVGIAGGILVLSVGLGLVNKFRRDQALADEVKARRAAAIAPVAQQAQAPDLTESPASLRQEIETTLVTDPLRAYLRAEALVTRNPGDGMGPELLEKARAGLAGGVSGATLAEYQKHLQNGDLETAAKVMDTLLRAQPEDQALRARASRLHLALCTAHASQAKWDEAQEDLLRGRALFPADKTWQVRLKLLETVKGLPKHQQADWISLLG